MNFMKRLIRNWKLKRNYIVRLANEGDVVHAESISALIEKSAKEREIGIANRPPEYITEKILEGKAVIAVTKKGELAGFCYIESWEHQKFVSISGMIVEHSHRRKGLSDKIKIRAFSLAQDRWPKAQILSITTSLPIMSMNMALGYQTVTFKELTNDEEFWKGCSSCKFYDILERTNKKNCLCTAMVYPKLNE